MIAPVPDEVEGERQLRCRAGFAGEMLQNGPMQPGRKRRDNISARQQACDETKTADDLKAAMVAAMGELPAEFFLDIAVKAVRA